MPSRNSGTTIRSPTVGRFGEARLPPLAVRGGGPDQRALV